ncbi:MAG: hypothetical protein KGH79_04945 [Patescibacteria group bacterium]|nr:hypothetical protein [Patescibacteria group bacterium]
MKNKLIYIIGGTIVAGSLMFGGSAYASTKAPAIFGTVTSVDGPNITVTGKTGRNKETTTYTVNASQAQVSAGLGLGAKKLATAQVAIGDQVAVLSVAS